jgi:hypothetical protein
MLNCRLEFLDSAAGSQPICPLIILQLAGGKAGCYFGGMRRLAVTLLFVLTVALLAFSEDTIRGNFVGDWSGSSGAGGKFRLSVADEGGKIKCTVSFDYAGEEVKTNVTLCKIEGHKIEAQYDYDLGGNRLQSIIHGERKSTSMEGKYHAIVLNGGAPVDEGDWKASPAQ